MKLYFLVRLPFVRNWHNIRDHVKIVFTNCTVASEYLLKYLPTYSRTNKLTPILKQDLKK